MLLCLPNIKRCNVTWHNYLLRNNCTARRSLNILKIRRKKWKSKSLLLFVLEIYMKIWEMIWNVKKKDLNKNTWFCICPQLCRTNGIFLNNIQYSIWTTLVILKQLTIFGKFIRISTNLKRGLVFVPSFSAPTPGFCCAQQGVPHPGVFF